ncbi:vanadium-dependent haloperoxidase [Rhodocytophaga aerolata]|uniref:Vanadium-dependent haloperoxidase n=1 Tax=Rhodocytophaga aerolata TaxID=455078 RepID=A0ABT8R9F5_9BACT|nr:vanadium-dependent haloperoxidase [Rhodocytophaga aerolata]MDO1448710.1 vanadium-dependent haloperoxidase [Rhodocytophaga aerolata]
MKTCYLLALVVWTCLLASCTTEEKREASTFKPDNPDVLHATVKKLTDVIVYDIFSPPVASRIYAYSSLAAYEAIRFQDPKQYPSFATKLNGFSSIPQPESGKTYDYTLAGIKALMTVAQKVTFSVDTLKIFEQNLMENYEHVLNKEVYDRSVLFGEEVGKAILARSTQDNYKQTRGFARYTVTESEGKWRPTPPDYMDATEPYWNTIMPLALDSAAHCRPPKPLEYKTDAQSPFYQEFKLVYDIGKNITEEQREIARFWDDNPFVSHHTGHATFATKKMTPGGHWMAIASLAARQTNADVIKSAQTYALTATALFDGFISCWEEKYRSQYIRPITVIHQQLDEHWEPLLQTPPFPEYSSGHGVISSSAATALTFLYGENFAFTDTTELEYGMGQRSFTSFNQAAIEASLSRLYGGIHYKFTCLASAEQGKKVGQQLLARTGLTKPEWVTANQ